ncbi:MAG: histidine kinase, partial [Holophagales bacterium]|nr:histidine kinase [Holophagales bacterium]
GLEYNLVVYFGIMATIQAFLYHTRFRRRELKASRLEAQLAMARLEVLKMQLHPHFPFNTLNAISALMHRDVHAADRMITLLSDLLRLSLDKDDRHQVPLGNELEFLERYLAIEKIRFRDRLVVRMDIDPSCLEAQVPRLILQPLVENSIRHGIAVHSAASLVAVRARRKGNRLDLSVSDDGPGMSSGKPSREGVGLANTRARLEQLYGDDHRFALERAETGGLRVHMEIPFEEAPREYPAADRVP